MFELHDTVDGKYFHRCEISTIFLHSWTHTLELLKFSKVLHCMCARASHVAIVCGNLISMVQLRLCFNCKNFPSYGTCEAVKCDSCTKFYLLGKYIENPMKPKKYQIWGRGVA